MKIKVMKLSDIDWDKDLDDESAFEKKSSDNVEGAADGTDTPLGSRERKSDIKVR